MKILFDTNVVLDVLLNRLPHGPVASRLMVEVERGRLAGLLGATTIATIHHLPPGSWVLRGRASTSGLSLNCTEKRKGRTRRKGSLADFFAASPLCGSGLEIVRAKDAPRDDGSFAFRPVPKTPPPHEAAQDSHRDVTRSTIRRRSRS